jgi:hypothetical protein
MGVTCARYTRIVTIKQVIVGSILGSAIVGYTVHSLCKEKRSPLMQTAKITAIRKEQALKKHSKASEAEISSRKLIG